MEIPKYAIMALLFVVIIKVMQITLFDADKYYKNKEASFAKVTEKKPELILEKKDNSSKETPTPALAQIDESDVSVDTSSESNNSAEVIDGQSLSSLKNSYLAPIVSKLPSGQLREDVVIRYYRHDKDEEKVSNLKELGYYIHEKEATETLGLGSNVIYYGEDVNIKDIQIVALSLLEKGIPLKSIQRSRYDWKSNSIEIGTDPNLIDKSAITEDYIMHFNK